MHSIPEVERNCKDINRVNFSPPVNLIYSPIVPRVGSELVLRRYRPGAINLCSSAFICGLVSEEAPYSKDSDRINRIDRIKPSTNPVNPVHPIQSGSSFRVAPDINCSEFIKESTSQKSRR